MAFGDMDHHYSTTHFSMPAAIKKTYNHPVIRDWLQLILLGLFAELLRRLSVPFLTWIWRVISITSIHSADDESYDWMMGEHLCGSRA